MAEESKKSTTRTPKMNGESLTSNGKKIDKKENAQGKKSKFVAYFLWLFGGFFGAHHLYLGRDEQAFVWICTLGGYFGIGWLRDIYRIPVYVAEYNNEPYYVEKFKNLVRNNPKPPFGSVRFLGAFLVSYLWGEAALLAIPEDELAGINFRPLILLVPLAVALGAWYVGNIGREKGTVWAPLIGAYLCYPSIWYFGEDTWMLVTCLVSCLAFDSFSKTWRLKTQKKRPKAKRAAIFFFSLLIYSSLWTSYFCFNATITDSEGEEIKLSDAVKHFFTSPIWTDLKASLQHSWNYAQHKGFWAMWKELIDLSDPRGEINAYKVLGLSPTSSQSEITSKWRTLSKENHPDKVKGSDKERREAQEKFMEIQQAYEILSSAKNRRQKRNRKPI